MAEVNGNTAGIKKHVLERLEGLYTEKVPKHSLISKEALELMAEITEQINREISVYVDRRGNIVDVSIGDSTTVGLQEWNEKRRERGLSGARCIHTHPSGQSELSDIDISALQLLRLDAMASCGVLKGIPSTLYIAYMAGKDQDGNREIMVEGPLQPEEVYHNNIMSTIRLVENLYNQDMEDEHSLEERAILVAIQTDEDDEALAYSMKELEQLADTAGVRCIGSVIQKRDRPDSRLFIGHGKAKEVSLQRQQSNADVVIFNHDLTPAQQRNLEEIIGCKIIDRTELILDIFAQRARTKEGKLQVELAQLNYLLPRLIGIGTSLSRLGGGIGTRGPGETKLEVDRRRIRKRVAELQNEIDNIQRLRHLHRNNRQAVPLPIVALVGYTNAGKSTLLNTLTGANVLAEDKLFATLDPTTRRLELPAGRTILLTDTVGFIEKIPHHLVAAFRATLEEVVEADLLLHVADLSHPMMEQHMDAVNKVLASLGAADKPVVMVLNKADLLSALEISSLEKRFTNSCSISAKNGYGLNRLFEIIDEQLPQKVVKVTFKFGYEEAKKTGLIRKFGTVLIEEYTDDGIAIQAEIDEINLARLNKALTCKEGDHAKS